MLFRSDIVHPSRRFSWLVFMGDGGMLADIDGYSLICVLESAAAVKPCVSVR